MGDRLCILYFPDRRNYAFLPHYYLRVGIAGSNFWAGEGLPLLNVEQS